MIEEILPIATAAIEGGVFAILCWTDKNIDPSKPSPKINGKKIVATAIIGAGVGIASVYLGFELTQDTVAAYLLMAGGATIVLEEIISTTWNWITNKQPAA